MKMFPVLLNEVERRRHPDCPREVPWELVAPHAQQAKANHYQSLETLARRGGLCPLELQAVLEDRAYGYDCSHAEAMARAVAFVKSLVATDGGADADSYKLNPTTTRA